MESRIIFITGGARSGKSRFAITEASKIIGRRAYIATAEPLDDEMKERIERHKMERGDEWDTYEEPIEIATVLQEIRDRYNVIVLDCMTMWLSNLLIGTQNTEYRIQTAETEIKDFLETIKSLKNSFVRNPSSNNCSMFIVSNEVGMGIVPDNEMARRFRDLAGFLNQKVAEIADEVYFLVSGIPLKIKW